MSSAMQLAIFSLFVGLSLCCAGEAGKLRRYGPGQSMQHFSEQSVALLPTVGERVPRFPGFREDHADGQRVGGVGLFLTSNLLAARRRLLTDHDGTDEKLDVESTKSKPEHEGSGQESVVVPDVQQSEVAQVIEDRGNEGNSDTGKESNEDGEDSVDRSQGKPGKRRQEEEWKADHEDKLLEQVEDSNREVKELQQQQQESKWEVAKQEKHEEREEEPKQDLKEDQGKDEDIDKREDEEKTEWKEEKKEEIRQILEEETLPKEEVKIEQNQEVKSEQKEEENNEQKAEQHTEEEQQAEEKHNSEERDKQQREEGAKEQENKQEQTPEDKKQEQTQQDKVPEQTEEAEELQEVKQEVGEQRREELQEVKQEVGEQRREELQEVGDEKKEQIQVIEEKQEQQPEDQNAETKQESKEDIKEQQQEQFKEHNDVKVERSDEQNEKGQWKVEPETVSEEKRDDPKEELIEANAEKKEQPKEESRESNEEKIEEPKVEQHWQVDKKDEQQRGGDEGEEEKEEGLIENVVGDVSVSKDEQRQETTTLHSVAQDTGVMDLSEGDPGGEHNKLEEQQQTLRGEAEGRPDGKEQVPGESWDKSIGNLEDQEITDKQMEFPGDKGDNGSSDILDSLNNPLAEDDTVDNEFDQAINTFGEVVSNVNKYLSPSVLRAKALSKQLMENTHVQVVESFSPLVGREYAPLIASLISYGVLLLPLGLVVFLFERLRAALSLQKIILFVNVYLAAYFTTLLITTLIIKHEPMLLLFSYSPSSYSFLQILQVLGYGLYFVLQNIFLISICTSEEFCWRFSALIQWVVASLIGLHYYILVFHRAMIKKAPVIMWKHYAVYSVCFVVLCFLSRAKRVKKEYVFVGDADTDKKN